jgi:hypothetical protein
MYVNNYDKIKRDENHSKHIRWVKIPINHLRFLVYKHIVAWRRYLHHIAFFSIFGRGLILSLNTRKLRFLIDNIDVLLLFGWMLKVLHEKFTSGLI